MSKGYLNFYAIAIKSKRQLTRKMTRDRLIKLLQNASTVEVSESLDGESDIEILWEGSEEIE